MFYATAGTSFFTLFLHCADGHVLKKSFCFVGFSSSTGLREKKGFSGLPC